MIQEVSEWFLRNPQIHHRCTCHTQVRVPVSPPAIPAKAGQQPRAAVGKSNLCSLEVV